MTEHQHVEWKSSWRDEYLEWICGFANVQGGRLVIGMDDAGQVVGVPNARKLLEDLPNRVRDLRGILVDVNFKTVEFLGVVPVNIASIDQPGLVDGLVDSQRASIGLVRRDPEILKPEMAKRIGISTAAIDKNIAVLKKLGLLYRVGSAKSGHWEARNPS